MSDIRFAEQPAGNLKIWIAPTNQQFNLSTIQQISNRFCGFLDVGGRTHDADWSVLSIIDRLPVLKGQPVELAAQWRGHTAILREIKLNIEFYIWKKRLERLKKQLTYLHEQSGKSKYTRRKYWIVTDDRGDPMEMNPQLKDFFKRKGWYGKQVDAIALDNECLWCTNFLYR